MILRSSYRNLAWVGFEPTTTEFCLDALINWAIRPWVQFTLTANLLQLLQFHLLFGFNQCFTQSFLDIPIHITMVYLSAAEEPPPGHFWVMSEIFLEFSLSAIVCNIFLEKLKNQAKSEKVRNIWYQLLCNSWVLVPKTFFRDWTIECVPIKFWDFPNIAKFPTASSKS